MAETAEAATTDSDIVVSNHASLEQRPEFKHSVSRTSLTFFTSDNAKQTAEKKFESLLENHNFLLSQSSDADKVQLLRKKKFGPFRWGRWMNDDYNIRF